jgi:hypothetical protein
LESGVGPDCVGKSEKFLLVLQVSDLRFNQDLAQLFPFSIDSRPAWWENSVYPGGTRVNLWPWKVETNNKPRERPEPSVVALPLTLQELSALAQFLVAVGESERTEIANKHVIDSIRDRIARFAERQGAWWDTPWSSSPVATHVLWSGSTQRRQKRIRNWFLRPSI